MSIWSGLSNFFSSPSALGFLSLAGANVYTNIENTRANLEAAQMATQGVVDQANAIREGNQQAQERFDQMRADAAPAQTYLRRQMVSNPADLTPNQKLQLEDLRRDTSASLAANGLRGAGRAQTAALRKVESDYLANAFDSNRNRSDSAASKLANQYTTATTQSADLMAKTGRAIGDASNQSALYGANATTANSALRGQAIGDIASLARSELKDQERESRYSERLDRATKL